MSQAEVWLELVTDDIPAAAERLGSAGVVRCDEIEPLPEGFEGFWISSPASIIHLVSSRDRKRVVCAASLASDEDRRVHQPRIARRRSRLAAGHSARVS